MIYALIQPYKVDPTAYSMLVVSLSDGKRSQMGSEFQYQIPGEFQYTVNFHPTTHIYCPFSPLHSSSSVLLSTFLSLRFFPSSPSQRHLNYFGDGDAGSQYFCQWSRAPDLILFELSQ